MPERTDAVAIHGNLFSLIGNEVKVGDAAPDFTCINNDLQPLNFQANYKGKICVLASVPSLDTPVCDIETRRFNREAEKLSSDVHILTISMDLPFAQKRWCGAAGVERVVTLSDHRDADFGLRYGVLIKELRLLARAVFVVDRQGKVCYIELVQETSEEPHYQAILDTIAELS